MAGFSLTICESLFMTPNINDFGQLIRQLRRQRQLKLVAVEKYVPASTLNAIENGRMLPSTAVLDDITRGFDMPVGALDLSLLPLVRGDEQRTELVRRLTMPPLENGLKVQRALRFAAMRDDLSVPQRMHAVVELANLLARRGAIRRAVWMMEYLLQRDEQLHGRIRLDILSSLGRFYLQTSQPERALGPILEAVRLRPHNDAWESAMCNLGLSWWLLGQYTNAADQWTRAVNTIRHPERLGNAYFGLGSMSLRQNNIPEAIQHYHQALVIYQQNAISASHQIRALNNLLACYIQIKDWTASEHTLVCGNAIVDDCDQEYQGEWIATQAELAWVQGRRNEAVQLIDQAKARLGTSLVLSWFTTRLVELRMLAPSTDEFWQAVKAIEQQGESLTDQNMRVSLSLVVIQVMMQKGLCEEATNQIRRLSATFPLIG